MGPGNPYCRIPEGLTGDVREDATGVAPGEGGGGWLEVRVGGSAVVVDEMLGLGGFGRDDRSKALSDAPAAADAAAMMARVVFDI
jgi:hypothetical protein